jgi:hypothetical protein
VWTAGGCAAGSYDALKNRELCRERAQLGRAWAICANVVRDGVLSGVYER